MKKIKTLLNLSFVLFFSLANGQAIDKFLGSYIKIDSTTSKYEKEGVWYADIDTTLLTLNNDMTFIYKWSPMFGPYSNAHILTTGTWKISNKKVILHSKYQEKEYRFFEQYKPEFGDSMVKVYDQTYDSLVGFFKTQFIGVLKDTARYSAMIFPDKEFSFNACSATFNISKVDEIVFYGDFGQMPTIKPKNNKSNCFLLQYNLSTNWDYQYFRNYPIKFKEDKIILGKKDYKIELKKM
jgi:hypothetical protein